MAAKSGPAEGRGAPFRGAALRTLALRLLVFAVAAGTASLLFLDLCDLFYDCGCVSLWAGGAAHCNIQTPGPPDCPYCAHPRVAYGALFGTIAVQGAVVFLPARKGSPGSGARGLLRRTIGALLAIPVVVGAVAGVLGLFTGYWAGYGG